MKTTIYAATVAGSMHGRVLVVRICGLVTSEAVRGIRHWIAARPELGALVSVLDYRRAVLAITQADMDAFAAERRVQTGAMPLAWVLSDEESAALWRQQAVRLAFAGRRRFVTCEPEAALAWATEQAQLRLASEQQQRAAQP